MLEAARELYALAPAEFTAARNRLAKELKAAGSADDAKIVAALRKPRLAEWALNRLARDDRSTVDRFALAIAAAQEAQSAAIGGDAGAIREATAELRRALATTADAAVRGLSAEGGNGEAQRDDLTAILRELVSAADATALLAGVIGSEALVTSGEFFPGAPDPQPHRLRLVPALAPDEVDAGAPAPATGSTAASSTAASSTAAARRAMAKAERHGLVQAVAAADKAAAAADTQVTEAAAELARRRAAAKTAAAAARAAVDALEAFDAEH